ncbi:hypothetical protein VTN96DRAFT_7347 [Rasamsonia emersonii]|uniref:Phospholipase/carboxylesterase/thioesterase domain-containing protein n=1 Tax=Rasamsonia emersonii (strain ATCC 16479 / CBS 393.64 / IMI 116815) TaxID=1408163 RepID=A0A0F4Z297_RASE3|nr:hypothetical protein T310_1740 [Rasamsonia emersonii CBS 393.64]KKA24201.1 hypothetical protein T310_1740 [Rasamsonia emersonii CBS 393.64]
MVYLFPPRHVYFPSTPKHTSTVILLHARGSNGPDLAFELATSYSSAGKTIFDHFPSTRWVFPSARARHYYWSQEQQFRGEDNLPEWFELESADYPHQPIPGLQDSVSYILRIVDEEVRRLEGNADRVFIGGVGQGMAVGLVALICAQRKLGGFVGAKGWIPFAGTLSSLLEKGEMDQAGVVLKTITFGQQQQQQQQAPGQQLSILPLPSQPQPQPPPSLDVYSGKAISGPLHVKETPVFLSHDEDNRLVDIGLGKTAHDTLQRLGFSELSWKTYPGGIHDSHGHRRQWLKEPKQLDDIVQFLGDKHLGRSG